MDKRIDVGIIGATGMVGQRYVKLLENHPYFRVVFVAASSRSSGKSYEEAVKNRWLIGSDLPKEVRNLEVYEAQNVEAARKSCRVVFSALEMSDKEEVRRTEEKYAAAGMAVISNASANRWTEDVPMLIPEINGSHLEVIASQKAAHGFGNGFIVVKPNCSIQSYMLPLFALIEAGYPVKNMIITTMQAISGSGYPGVSAFDLVDNLVPFIGGEEEKTEKECLKILGKVEDGVIKNAEFPHVSSTCTRVNVVDGHTASVSLEFDLPEEKKPSLAEVERVWKEFSSEAQRLHLPSAPEQPIVVRHEENRPQPRRDRETGNGMSVVLGRLRKCSVMDIKFVALSHNTKRGAASGGIFNAEFLKAKGYFDFL